MSATFAAKPLHLHLCTSAPQHLASICTSSEPRLCLCTSQHIHLCCTSVPLHLCTYLHLYTSEPVHIGCDADDVNNDDDDALTTPPNDDATSTTVADGDDAFSTVTINTVDIITTPEEIKDIDEVPQTQTSCSMVKCWIVNENISMTTFQDIVPN